MGMNAVATISLGILFDEEAQLPWNGEEYDGDMEDWWYHVKGGAKANPNEFPFTPEGNYKEGFSRASNCVKTNAWFDWRQEWREENPCPVDLVSYGSDAYRREVLIVKDAEQRVYDYEPEILDAKKIMSLKTALEGSSMLKKFCKEYGIEHEDGPHWYLSAYYG